MAFSDYYQPCEPGSGLLVNGQYYRTRFGKETLQMMVSDGVFASPDDIVCESCALKDTHAEDIEYDLSEAERHIELLEEQVRELGAEPVELEDEE